MHKDHPDLSDNMISRACGPGKSKFQRKLFLSLSLTGILLGLGHTMIGSAYKAPTPDLMELGIHPLDLPSSPVPNQAHATLPNTKLEMAALKIPKWETLTIEKDETLSTALYRAGMDSTLALPIADAGKLVYPLYQPRSGDSLEVQKGAGNRLEKVRLHLNPEKTLLLQAQGDGFSTHANDKFRVVRREKNVVVIRKSMFEDGQRAGLSDAIILAAAHIFRYDIDFAKELHRGAILTLIHDVHYAGNRKVSDGDILAAELKLDGKTYRLMRFKYPDGSIKYADPDGRMTERTFIRTPVAFTRISSKFSLARFHPILGRWLAHKGVDYAAPKGTPVMATANATVETAGQENGYGNLIVLRHDRHISMAYGHLSRFAKGIRPGVKVKLGEVIGYVGETGLATGPHLHYEFRINGVAQDPLKVALPKGDPLPNNYRMRYRQEAARYLALLDDKPSTQIAMR